MKKYLRKNNCRVCSGVGLVKILDLGAMPPANSFLSKKDLSRPEEKFPLAVYFCKNCGLLQLQDVIHPRFLYTHYDYMSSASKPLADYLARLGLELATRFIKFRQDLVIDIGGNDGTLLATIRDKCRVLNIEPASKIAKLARDGGVETLNNFFSEKLAKLILKNHGLARVVTANNVVAHIDDLPDFFKGVKLLIGDSGIFAFDVHWVGNLVGAGGFDQIYHEHLCYFSLGVLKKFIASVGLNIFDVQLTSMHGASLRVFTAKDRPLQKSVGRILDKEKEMGLAKLATYQKFAQRVKKNREELIATLLKLKKQGRTIIGYGAPAKGNTLFNFCGIDNQIIDFITDTTPFKQGLFTPGSHIPVLHPDEFSRRKPDYAILLAWNYADMILEKEKKFRQSGGKFIIPVPRVRII